MDKLVLIPFFISILLLVTRDHKDVFILVFLPALTLIPTYFDCKLQEGIPELYFWSSALIPILIAWALKNFEGYTYHWVDMVILLYILMIFYAQWVTSEYKPAQKILFNKTFAIFFSYILVKSYCQDRNNIIKIIKMMTFLGAFVAIFNIYEFKMFTNFFDEILRKIWPHSVVWDTGMVMSRWGFKRAFGPFSHPIVSGYIFSILSPLALWCYFQGHYKSTAIGKAIILLNIMGVFVSLSRAPIIGLLMGLLVIGYGWAKNKQTITTIMLILAIVTSVYIIPQFIMYASVTRATADTVEQRNVAYRKEMWEAYYEVVMEKPVFGWGAFGVPKLRGMDSIDSEYLGIALTSGLIALGFYLIFLIGILIKLFLYAHKRSFDDPWARLSWCIIAGWISVMFSQGTVYSGAQAVQYLFMLGGMGQAVILLYAPQEIPEQIPDDSYVLIGHGFHFNRVL